MTACGGGGSTAARGTQTAATTGRGTSSTTPSDHARTPVTKRQATTFADAVNLTAADIPGLTAAAPEHEHDTAAEKRLEHEAGHCAGALSSTDKLIEASSKHFKRGHGIPEVSVSSEVSVARTAQLAARELAAIRSKRARTCFSHYLGQFFKGKEFHGARISPISIASGTPPAAGSTGGFGWRVSVTISAHGLRIPFWIDILGFVYGPAQVSLFSYGVPVPFPAAVQQRLFLLLLERAKAHGTALSVAHG